MATLPLIVLAGVALAQSGPPDRRIPPPVLAEVTLLENRFELALAQDCDAARCYPKGCVYVDHAVSDRGSAPSLPGLGLDLAPMPQDPQTHLTRARCAFAHEEDLDGEDVAALARRLGTKLSTGWVAVSVTHQPLKALPEYLREAPAPEPDADAPQPEPEPEPVPRSETRELWEALLPHLWWMIGVGLVTLAGTLLIWAFRRVGQPSIEDRMLLAELERGAPEPEAPAPAVDPDATVVASADAHWRERLAAVDPTSPDPELQALVRELLRAGELPLLAKAMLTFPDTLPRVFPEGGDVATAKLELAAFLKDVDPADLPDDVAFFRALNRHALAASVASQGDARIVRALQEEFGAAGLAQVIGEVAPRSGALLFALAPLGARHEMLRLLAPTQLRALADRLLRSDRLDPAETAHLFELVQAVRRGDPLPHHADADEVTDRGARFDAVGPLSALLEGLSPATRAALFRAASDRSQGNLPDWTRGVLTADLLLALPTEARADLMLAVDARSLAAWLSVIVPDARARLLTGVPDTLRNTVRASSAFASRDEQLALAERGRAALAAGFQAQLARAGLRFEDVARAEQTG